MGILNQPPETIRTRDKDGNGIGSTNNELHTNPLTTNQLLEELLMLQKRTHKLLEKAYEIEITEGDID